MRLRPPRSFKQRIARPLAQYIVVWLPCHYVGIWLLPHTLAHRLQVQEVVSEPLVRIVDAGGMPLGGWHEMWDESAAL